MNYGLPPHFFPIHDYPKPSFEDEYGYVPDFRPNGSRYIPHFTREFIPYNVHPCQRVEVPCDEVPLHHQSEMPYCDEIDSSHPYYKPRKALQKFLHEDMPLKIEDLQEQKAKRQTIELKPKDQPFYQKCQRRYVDEIENDYNKIIFYIDYFQLNQKLLYDRFVREDRNNISPRFLYPNKYIRPKHHFAHCNEFGRSLTNPDEIDDEEANNFTQTDFTMCPRYLHASHKKCHERYYQQKFRNKASNKKTFKDELMIMKSSKEGISDRVAAQREQKLYPHEGYRNPLFHELRQQRLEEDEKRAYDNNFDDYKKTVKYYNPQELNMRGGGKHLPCHNFDDGIHRSLEFYQYNPDKAEQLEKSKSIDFLKQRDYKDDNEQLAPKRKYFKFQERVEDKYPEENKEYQKLIENSTTKEKELSQLHPAYNERKKNSKPKDIKQESPIEKLNEERKEPSFSTPVKRNKSSNEELEALSIQFQKYAELQLQEEIALNDLYVQKNYSIFKAFELLTPHHGLVNSEALFNALKNNLGIEIDDITICEDIIARLAYNSETNLMMSDMKFFEPTADHVAYEVYKSNISRSQNSKDKSWHQQYKQVWKCLIETDLNRREIQKLMATKYCKAIDSMFTDLNLGNEHMLTVKDLELFVSRYSKDIFSEELAQCLMKAIDRNEDNLASYIELQDAIFGSE